MPDQDCACDCPGCGKGGTVYTIGFGRKQVRLCLCPEHSRGLREMVGWVRPMRQAPKRKAPGGFDPDRWLKQLDDE